MTVLFCLVGLPGTVCSFAATTLYSHVCGLHTWPQYWKFGPVILADIMSLTMRSACNCVVIVACAYVLLEEPLL